LLLTTIKTNILINRCLVVGVQQKVVAKQHNLAIAAILRTAIGPRLIRVGIVRNTVAVVAVERREVVGARHQRNVEWRASCDASERCVLTGLRDDLQSIRAWQQHLIEQHESQTATTTTTYLLHQRTTLTIGALERLVRIATDRTAWQSTAQLERQRARRVVELERGVEKRRLGDVEIAQRYRLTTGFVERMRHGGAREAVEMAGG
jgi:hypothetical protein